MGARNVILPEAKQLDSRCESGTSIGQEVDGGVGRKSGKSLLDGPRRESEGSTERNGGRTDLLKST